MVKESSRDNANNYNYDCGRCGRSFDWEVLKSSQWNCPYCGWDSVRMSPKQKRTTWSSSPNLINCNHQNRITKAQG